LGFYIKDKFPNYSFLNKNKKGLKTHLKNVIAKIGIYYVKLPFRRVEIVLISKRIKDIIWKNYLYSKFSGSSSFSINISFILLAFMSWILLRSSSWKLFKAFFVESLLLKSKNVNKKGIFRYYLAKLGHLSLIQAVLSGLAFLFHLDFEHPLLATTH